MCAHTCCEKIREKKAQQKADLQRQVSLAGLGEGFEVHRLLEFDVSSFPIAVRDANRHRNIRLLGDRLCHLDRNFDATVVALIRPLFCLDVVRRKGHFADVGGFAAVHPGT
jgi:hypothetical protein